MKLERAPRLWLTTAMALLPKVFIGSSVEGLPIAEGLQVGLDYAAECTIWSQGVFGLSQNTLDDLLKQARESDFAVLVMTPGDPTIKRGRETHAARDNVLFELGLFVGALGRERTFMVYCRDEQLELPTDLAGVTPATFAKRSDGNLQAALGPVCTKLKTAMTGPEVPQQIGDQALLTIYLTPSEYDALKAVALDQDLNPALDSLIHAGVHDQLRRLRTIGFLESIASKAIAEIVDVASARACVRLTPLGTRYLKLRVRREQMSSRPLSPPIAPPKPPK